MAEIPRASPTHNLVLNKYPVIFNHFISATKENKPQTDLLEEDDLYLAYACLQSWKENGQPLFAFFNSGEHSGASQPHRHLQFLPVQDMRGNEESDWGLLCNTMNSPIHEKLSLLCNPGLPFVHFATKLQASMTGSEIRAKYLLLMRAALASISTASGLNALDTVIICENGRTTFSYNLAMTTDLIAILPRKNEASDIPGLSGSSVAINGTILAGTMMVKAEDEWTAFRNQPGLMAHVLNQITYSRIDKPSRDNSL